MYVILWITQATLAAIFLGAGAATLLQSKAKLEPKMGWFSDSLPQTDQIDRSA